MGVVVVTGVPGVGKSTVMGAAEEYGYKIVNFGTTMFEEAQKEGVSDRDDMRKLTIEDQQRLQKQAGEKISEMGNVVVDTHASILTPSGYIPGLPEWTVRALNPDIIVLVEATPDEIAGRRNKDASRARDNDDIGLHQSVNREYAATAAVMTGATVSIVENHDNQVDIAVEQFRKILGKE
jgi:adenylate kinase